MPVRLSFLDRRRQILRTASVIFARRGYRGATTREIAERAGINEALLFRHFPSKEKLYWTLIEELCSARGRRQNITKIIAAGGTDLEIFTAIAREMLVRNARDTELTRLLWFTALESHTLSQGLPHLYRGVLRRVGGIYPAARPGRRVSQRRSAALSPRLPGYGG